MRVTRRRRRDADVLVLCTGNVCRSPYVAARLRHALPGLTITAAGTGVTTSRPVSRTVLDLLVEHGIDAPPQLSLGVDRRMIESATLIITAEHLHRVQAAQIVPGAAERTFTLRELARLLGPTPPELAAGVEAALRRAQGARTLAATSGFGPDLLCDDLADPYAGPTEGYLRMARDADGCLRQIIPALGGSDRAGASRDDAEQAGGRPTVTATDSLASVSWTTPS